MNTCRSCQNEMYDSSVGYSECRCMEQMTEEQYDKYFCEQKKGCPFFVEMVDEYEYGKSLGIFV